MKQIVLFALFLCIATTSLSAYSKKIVFSAFSNSENASLSLEEYKTTQEYEKLFKLSQENSFKIYYRASGKYFVIIAEPIFNKRVGIEAFELVKSKYKSAYTMVYVGEKEVGKIPTIEPVDKNISQEIEILKEEKQVVETKEIDKRVVLQKEQNRTIEEIEKSVLEEKEAVHEEIEQREFIDIWVVIRYVVIFFFLFVVTFYYIKFRRLYDEY